MHLSVTCASPGVIHRTSINVSAPYALTQPGRGWGWGWGGDRGSTLGTWHPTVGRMGVNAGALGPAGELHDQVVNSKT